MTLTTGAGPGRSTAEVAQPHHALDPAWVRRLTGYAVTSPKGATMTTITPMSGAPLAELPLSSTEDVTVAVQGARAVQRSWAQLPMSARAQIILAFHDLLLTHQVEMLDLIQLESGKARVHAFEEIVHVCQIARHYATTAGRYLKPRRHPGMIPFLTEVVEMRHPKGVVGIVAPWNYPLSMGITDAIPALLAGNAVVVRPDTQTSLTLLFCAELLSRAGLPPRVLQVVLGRGSDVGAAVFEQADYVCFTGSTKTGRRIAAQAGERLVSSSLELGGKNPMYVAEDADLPRAVECALRACFASAGQLCVSIERLILHEAIADEFLSLFLPAVQGMRLSPQLTYGADMGSLVSAEQLSVVEGHVADAVAKGARVLTGGRARPDIGPFFYEPTVLADVTPDMAVCRDETFGPLVSVYRVRGDAEGVRVANDTDYGLNAAVFTGDTRRGQVLAAAIKAGTVNVNEGYAAAFASVASPMGGMKASGLGRRQGSEGILKYTEAQTIATQRLMGLGVPPRLSQERYADVVSGYLGFVRALRRP